MSTPTPRTDEAAYRVWGIENVNASLSRTLETELTTALARVAELEKDCLNNIKAHAKLSYQKNSEIDSLTRQLSESQAQLADMTRKFQSEQRSIQHIVKVFKEEKAELEAQLTSLREANAVLQSQVDNADINLEQVRMAQKGLWRTKVESAESRIRELEAQLASAQGRNRFLEEYTPKTNLDIIEVIKLLNVQLTSAREDGARLDWLEKETKASPTGISFDWCRYAEEGQLLEHGFRFMRRHFLGDRKKDLRAAIDSARGHLAETPAGGETGKAKASRWSYSSYRATLKLDEKSWAIVSPDGRNALSAADAALLERAMNTLDASLLPPPPQGKETRE